MSKIVAKIPVLIQAAKPKLREFNRFAKVELYPPSPIEIPRIISGFSGLVRSAATGKWRTLSVREAWLNTLITVEVICWFFVGEVIGKRHVRGYDV